MPPRRLSILEPELREDRGRLGRPGALTLAPELREPVAQLSVARVGVENTPDDELRRNRPVPLVLLEPEGDVERNLLPEAVELPPEPERDRTAGILGPVLDPEAEVLAVTDCGDVAELAARDEQRHTRIAEPEGREAGQLGAELECQLRAVDERVDGRSRTQLGLGKVLVCVRGERGGKRLDAGRIDRKAGGRTVAAEADEVLGAGSKAGVKVERRRRPA